MKSQLSKRILVCLDDCSKNVWRQRTIPQVEQPQMRPIPCQEHLGPVSSPFGEDEAETLYFIGFFQDGCRDYGAVQCSQIRLHVRPAAIQFDAV